MTEPTQADQDAAADKVAFERHRSEEGARLAFAEELDRMRREHEARVRRINRQDLAMKLILALTVLIFGLTAFFKLKSH